MKKSKILISVNALGEKQYIKTLSGEDMGPCFPEGRVDHMVYDEIKIPVVPWVYWVKVNHKPTPTGHIINVTDVHHYGYWDAKAYETNVEKAKGQYPRNLYDDRNFPTLYVQRDFTRGGLYLQGDEFDTYHFNWSTVIDLIARDMVDTMKPDIK